MTTMALISLWSYNTLFNNKQLMTDHQRESMSTPIVPQVMTTRQVLNDKTQIVPCKSTKPWEFEYLHTYDTHHSWTTLYANVFYL